MILCFFPPPQSGNHDTNDYGCFFDIVDICAIYALALSRENGTAHIGIVPR